MRISACVVALVAAGVLSLSKLGCIERSFTTRDDAMKAECESRMRGLLRACELYKKAQGKFPSRLGELVEAGIVGSGNPRVFHCQLVGGAPPEIIEDSGRIQVRGSCFRITKPKAENAAVVPLIEVRLGDQVVLVGSSDGKVRWSEEMTGAKSGD